MYTFINGIAFICFLPALFAFPGGWPWPSNQDIRFTDIVIFGDSYSDNGNVYRLTDRTYPVSPPYWYGRFCNGPMWVDQLYVSGIENYAYGSATTDNNLVQGYTKGNTVPVPGILQQVQTYLNQNKPSKSDFNCTLYIISGGANDFIFNSTLTPVQIVPSLLKSVTTLLAAGAKYILVFNQVPFQSYPFTRPFNNVPLFTEFTDAANELTTVLLAQIQTSFPQASLNIFNLNLVISKVLAPSTYFTNTVDNCWVAVNATYVQILCPNPDRYVFLDVFHVTTRVHALIAEALRPFFYDSYQVNNAACYILPA
jgi:outer membrane lipase/esterase